MSELKPTLSNGELTVLLGLIDNKFDDIHRISHRMKLSSDKRDLSELSRIRRKLLRARAEKRI